MCFVSVCLQHCHTSHRGSWGWDWWCRNCKFLLCRFCPELECQKLLLEFEKDITSTVSSLLTSGILFGWKQTENLLCRLWVLWIWTISRAQAQYPTHSPLLQTKTKSHFQMIIDFHQIKRNPKLKDVKYLIVFPFRLPILWSDHSISIWKRC